MRPHAATCGHMRSHAATCGHMLSPTTTHGCARRCVRLRTELRAGRLHDSRHLPRPLRQHRSHIDDDHRPHFARHAEHGRPAAARDDLQLPRLQGNDPSRRCPPSRPLCTHSAAPLWQRVPPDLARRILEFFQYKLTSSKSGLQETYTDEVGPAHINEASNLQFCAHDSTAQTLRTRGLLCDARRHSSREGGRSQRPCHLSSPPVPPSRGRSCRPSWRCC